MIHKHHIIPKHAGGTDDPSNLVELTIEDHAIAHKVLYGLYGRWQDKLAYEGLLKQKPVETRLQAIREGIARRDNSYNKCPERRKKISEAHKGKPKSEAHKAAMQKPKSEEHAKKLNNILNTKTKCPHCEYESTRGAVTRHMKKYHV